jgi:hypothetical protein
MEKIKSREKADHQKVEVAGTDGLTIGDTVRLDLPGYYSPSDVSTFSMTQFDEAR